MQRNLALVIYLFKSEASVANCMTNIGLQFTLGMLRNNFYTARNINSCPLCNGAIFETEGSETKTHPVQCEHGLNAYRILGPKC